MASYKKRSIEELREGKSEATPYSDSDSPELDSAYRKGIRTAVQETFWTWQVEAKRREEKAFLELKPEHAMVAQIGIG